MTYWIGTQPGSPNEPFIRPRVSFTARLSAPYSGTSLRLVGAI